MSNDIDALLYNTPTNNSLTRMSAKLLDKYKNNRGKTVMIMNHFKKRKRSWTDSVTKRCRKDRQIQWIVLHNDKRPASKT